MKPKTLAILAGAAVVVLAAALFVSSGNDSSVRSRAIEKGEEPLLLPDLAKRVNDAARITIAKNDQETVLARSGDRWTVASRGGYPADFDKVRSALINLSQAKVVAEKTSRADRYDLLGVADAPNDDAGKKAAEEAAKKTPADSQTIYVTIADASGGPLGSLIVGKAEEAPKTDDSPFGVPTGRYFVRRAGEAQSYLADIKPPGDASPMGWVKRDMISLERARTRSATVSHADGQRVTAVKTNPADAEFALEDLPSGRELTYPGSPSQLATSLEYITFDDVKPASELDLAKEPLATSVFRTFDGLVVTARLSKVEDKDWMTLEASTDPAIVDKAAGPAGDASKPEAGAKAGEATPGEAVPGEAKPGESTPGESTPGESKPDESKAETPKPPSGVTFKTPDEVKKEADELNSRLKGWAFQIPEYKAKQVAAHISDLTKEAPPPANPTQGPPTPATGAPGPALTPELPQGPVPLAHPEQPEAAPPPHSEPGAEEPGTSGPGTSEAPKQDGPKR